MASICQFGRYSVPGRMVWNAFQRKYRKSVRSSACNATRSFIGLLLFGRSQNLSLVGIQNGLIVRLQSGSPLGVVGGIVEARGELNETIHRLSITLQSLFTQQHQSAFLCRHVLRAAVLGHLDD